MTEESEALVEEYPCPKCQQPQKEFILYGKAPTPMCPSCKLLVPSGSLPAHLVIKRESSGKKRPRRRKQKPAEPEHEPRNAMDEPEERERRSRIDELFDRPRSQHEILEDILTEFNLNEEFIHLMVARSRRQGGIHPYDLRFYLKSLNSGLPRENKDEVANFICDEYYYALQQAEKQSQEFGVPTGYPLGGPGQPPRSPGRPNPLYKSESGWRAPTAPEFRPSYREELAGGINQQLAQGTSLTAEDVARIIEEKMMRKREEERLDQLERMILERDRAFTEKLAEINRQNQEMIQSMVEKISSTQQQFLTPQDLQSFALERERDYQKALNEQNRQMMEQMIAYTKERNLNLEQQNRALLDELKKQQGLTAAGDFKDDGMKLAATAISRAVDSIENRQPMKDIITGLSQLASQKPPEELQKPRKTSKDRIAEMLSEEYIETTDEPAKEE